MQQGTHIINPEGSVAPKPYKQTLVVRLLGKTWTGSKAENRQLAILEWSADNRVRLFDLDPAAMSIKATVVDCAPTDIKSFIESGFSANLCLNNDEFLILDFADEAIQAASAGKDMRSPNFYVQYFFYPDEQRALLHESSKDLEWWTWNFMRSGVKTS